MGEPSYTFDDFVNDYMGIHAIVATDKIRAIWDKIYNQGYSDGWDQCLSETVNPQPKGDGE